MRAFVLLVCTLVLAAVGGAESVPPSSVLPMQPQQPPLTQDMVDDWIRVWQKRLGLAEWRIEARIVRSADLPQNAVANIHWSIPTHKATVKVLAACDSSLKGYEMIEDTELSVVHELIHLSLAKLPLDPNHTDQEEETVKRISSALLALDKRK
jgi:hypothetical protein